MKQDIQKTIKQVPELPNIPDYNFENVFNVYKQDDFYAFNIIKNINIPTELDDEVFYYYRVPGKIAWTALSHKLYGSINLWWLLCIANKIINPVILPEPGMLIRVIYMDQIPGIISAIQSQVK
tara:strand:+ start:204 stop:572 length:369 start_codon:yes stop_codon:yes gene_type:complete